MSGTVDFSIEASCWTYRCQWGCFAFDFEGEQEATEALLSHPCDRTS